MKINNRKDILLLLLYSPGVQGNYNEPIVGRTRLMKLLFLFKKEALSHFQRGTDINDDNFYKFFPWDFGPFSTEVYDDLIFFTLQGFIDSSESEDEALPESASEWAEWMSTSGIQPDDENYNEYEEETFRLTNKGVLFTKPMYDFLSDSQKRLLKEFKKKLASAPLRAILRYVYDKYPDTTERSKIKSEILHRF